MRTGGGEVRSIQVEWMPTPEQGGHPIPSPQRGAQYTRADNLDPCSLRRRHERYVVVAVTGYAQLGLSARHRVVGRGPRRLGHREPRPIEPCR